MADVFDLTRRGQRSESFEFELLEGSTLRPKGELHPLRDAAPTLTQQAGASIKRSLTLPLAVEDAERLLPSDRVAVWMHLGDDRYPLGQYLQTSDIRQDYADDVDDPASIRTLSALALDDQMVVINTEMELGFTARLENADDTIRRLLEPLGILVNIEGSDIHVSNSWTLGESRLSILEVLTEFGGYLAPWIDSTGALRAIRAFDPADRLADFDFDESSTVIRESITRSNSLLIAPNRIVVVGNAGSITGADGAEQDAPPLVAFADVPSTAPHSATNLGFVRPQVVEAQVTSLVQASTLAETLALTQTAVETVELSGALDPRHEAWQVVRFEGANWLELGWSMELVAGGAMQHSLQRVYPATPQVLGLNGSA